YPGYAERPHGNAPDGCCDAEAWNHARTNRTLQRPACSQPDGECSWGHPGAGRTAVEYCCGSCWNAAERGQRNSPGANSAAGTDHFRIADWIAARHPDDLPAIRKW